MLRPFIFAILLPGAVCAGPVDDARELYIAGDYAAALEVLVPAAEAGDANAQNILGDAYDRGNGVEVDHAAALGWWERSAAQGFDKAQYNLGLVYESGTTGVEADYRRAAEYFEQAMENGNPAAPTNLGLLYEQGHVGVAPGFGPNAPDPEPDYERAAELYEVGIERGDLDSMNNLANLLVGAQGVDEDLGRAFDLFAAAAAQGHAGALSNLGVMYASGYGASADPLAAFALYGLAAREGYAQAAVNMAWMLYEGDAPGGTPDDPAVPLAYCWWGVDLERQTGASAGESRFAEDCGALAEGLDDAAVDRAGDLADGLSGLSSAD